MYRHGTQFNYDQIKPISIKSHKCTCHYNQFFPVFPESRYHLHMCMFFQLPANKVAGRLCFLSTRWGVGGWGVSQGVWSIPCSPGYCPGGRPSEGRYPYRHTLLKQTPPGGRPPGGRHNPLEAHSRRAVRMILE